MVSAPALQTKPALLSFLGMRRMEETCHEYKADSVS